MSCADEEAIKIEQEWPVLGEWGSGSIAPQFEVQPAEYLKEFLSYLLFAMTALLTGASFFYGSNAVGRWTLRS
jgi:hypothetical protein